MTFIGGIVLLVFAGLAMTNDDMLLAILTAVISAAILVFAIYDMFRIVQKISQVTTLRGLERQRGMGPHRGAQRSGPGHGRSRWCGWPRR